jgi:hypothetical protein
VIRFDLDLVRLHASRSPYRCGYLNSCGFFWALSLSPPFSGHHPLTSGINPMTPVSTGRFRHQPFCPTSPVSIVIAFPF